MNAITKIDLAGALEVSTRDRELLALFARYQIASVDHHNALFRSWSDPTRDRWMRVTWKRMERLRSLLLATEATSVIGIAVKLAICAPSIIQEDCGSRQLDHMNEPVRRALQDALRLSGLTLSQVEPHAHSRRASDPLLPRRLEAA
ncbi:hypothetical protein [Methyloligella halotolerans]|nr:hypothetical protein [Methyloligella halotolerans]